MKITDWGAKVQQILVPDRNGVLGDVALGYDSIDQLQAGQASDSPNKSQFPSTVLNPGEWYSGKTVDKFSVRK